MLKAKEFSLVPEYLSFRVIFSLVYLSRWVVQGKQPNIVIALADDLGWSDVGYNKLSGIKTPHIDKLASEGVILNNHYVQPLCSPSRASLLTGKYPIHIGAGLNENVFAPDEDAGLPMAEKLLPEYLQDLGYSTGLFGKWHLGMAKTEYLPTRRGFGRFYGFYSGAIDYYKHNQTAYRCLKMNQSANFLDLRDQETVVRDKAGRYSPDLFNKEALDFIDRRDANKPFFLLMSYQNVHSPLQSPQYNTEEYKGFSDKNRQTYGKMVTHLDNSLHNLTLKLHDSGIWNNTLLLFMSDNGGNPTESGYNWPLRGAKGTLWEGGIRSASFLSGGYLKKAGFESNALVHISDWLPTLLNVARENQHEGSESAHDRSNEGKHMSVERKLMYPRMNSGKPHRNSGKPQINSGKPQMISGKSSMNSGTSPMPKIDGINVWKAITSVGVASPRKYIIHNINNQSYAIRKGRWKLIKEVDMGWAEPPENAETRRKNITAKPLDPNTFKGYLLDQNLPRVIDGLFDVSSDKAEENDLREENSEIVKELLEIINKYKKSKIQGHRVYKCNGDAVKKAELVQAWGPFLK